VGENVKPSRAGFHDQLSAERPLSQKNVFHFFQLGVFENSPAGFVLNFKVKCMRSNDQVLVKAVFMHNINSLALILWELSKKEDEMSSIDHE